VPSARLTVCRLPPYAHELNPVEPVWAHLKRSLANLIKHRADELTALVKTRLKRMQYRSGLLLGFLDGTCLEFGPFCNTRPQRSLEPAAGTQNRSRAADRRGGPAAPGLAYGG
jgi:hypothetical protein